MTAAGVHTFAGMDNNLQDGLWASLQVFAALMLATAPTYIVSRLFVKDKPLLLSFEFVAFFVMIWLTYKGFEFYLFEFGNLDLAERVLLPTTVGRQLAQVMIGYQLYSTLMCLACEDLRKFEMYLHHAATAFVAYVTLMPYCSGYAWFYLGVIETTSIVLTFIDLFKSFPSLIKKYPQFYFVVRIIFGVLFIAIRVVWMVTVLAEYMVTYARLVQAGHLKVHNLHIVFNVLLSFLILLQFYWTRLIIANARRALKGLTSGKGKTE